ncbi:ketosteroid isomerase [Labrys miyagiensis]|uniref:Ketosteroid isomerase n=1 Tax=Labrys miyagiensis TaxID=346912 RepID=A0ABQ6CQG5_9HYPH|nr:SgcJ/EcaC family oxidoreductase [Labrys miyagiensis]GLS22563.1 ketosteroid isomerase [Labrys miyagiensis]
MTADEKAIRDVVDLWMSASKKGDVATVLDLMTDDVIFMVPGHAPFGKSAFREAAEANKQMRVEGHAEVLEVEVLGNRAWLRNRLEITVTPPDGEAMHRSGHTLTILRKGDDGRWRLMRDANLVM